MKQPYRLALDIGTNSIGWCVLDLKKSPEVPDGDLIPCKIRKMGVRLFTEPRNPKDGTTLASRRRDKRGARRNLFRYKQRQGKLIKILKKHGLFPNEEKESQELKNLNPYYLRVKALDDSLAAYEFGRALYNLSIRRGFKSNRKTADEKGASKLKQAIANLKKTLEAEKARTVGEFLYNRLLAGKSVKFSYDEEDKTDSDEVKNFFLDRSLVEDEFEVIWETQKSLSDLDLNDQMKEDIKKSIFDQRPLKSQKETIGKCSFETYYEDGRKIPFADRPIRANKGLVSFEIYRLLQTLINLRYSVINENLVSEKSLSSEQILKFINLAFSNPTNKLSFEKMRKLLNLENENKFNLEINKIKKLSNKSKTKTSSKKEDIDFVPTLTKLSKYPEFKAYLCIEKILEVDNFLELIANNVDDDELITKLQSDFALADDRLDYFYETALPDLDKCLGVSYASISLKAINKLNNFIIDNLRQNKVEPNHYEYVKKVYPHAGKQKQEIQENLPYYGELDMTCLTKAPKGYDYDFYISNPTVHVALNELRKVVNALIEKYGQRPESIHIELARDLKNSKKQKDNIKNQQSFNESINEEFEKICVPLGANKDNRDDRVKYRLWKEMSVDGGRKCLYSGRSLGEISNLFSPNIQIEHIKPFSRSLDDGLSNKILVYHSENIGKSNKTPFEAYSNDTDKWKAIKERAFDLFYIKNKRKYQNIISEDAPKADGFLERHLNDTRYISRVAKEYLSVIVDKPSKVVVLNGGLTSQFNHSYDLYKLLDPDSDGKNRDDNRHHALDAFAIGVIDRSLINKIHRLSGQNDRITNFSSAILSMKNSNDVTRILADLPTMLDKIVISQKPDRSIEGEMHEETIYGAVKPSDWHKYWDEEHKPAWVSKLDRYDGDYYLPTKKFKLDEFKKVDDIKGIVDKGLRKLLQVISGQIQDQIMDHKETEQIKKIFEFYEKNFGELPKRIKCFVSLSPVKMLVKKDERGDIKQAFKYGNNAFCLIYQNEKGKYQFKVVQRAEAYLAFKEYGEKYISALAEKYCLDGFFFIDVIFPKDTLEAKYEDDNSKEQKVFLNVSGFAYRSLKSGDSFGVTYSYALAPLKIQRDMPVGKGEFSPSGFQKYNMKKVFISPIGVC